MSYKNENLLYSFFFSQYIRWHRIGPFGEPIHAALRVFLDDKDSGPLILTHVYLLLGFAVPLWIYPVDYMKPDTTGEYCLSVVYVLRGKRIGEKIEKDASEKNQ